jgi:hypothetical protein
MISTSLTRRIRNTIIALTLTGTAKTQINRYPLPTETSYPYKLVAQAPLQNGVVTFPHFVLKEQNGDKFMIAIDINGADVTEMHRFILPVNGDNPIVDIFNAQIDPGHGIN